MVDAGWIFYGWDPPHDVMWRHADEWAAAATHAEAREFYLAQRLPDPYEILERRRVDTILEQRRADVGMTFSSLRTS